FFAWVVYETKYDARGAKRSLDWLCHHGDGRMAAPLVVDSSGSGCSFVWLDARSALAITEINSALYKSRGTLVKRMPAPLTLYFTFIQINTALNVSSATAFGNSPASYI